VEKRFIIQMGSFLKLMRLRYLELMAEMTTPSVYLDSNQPYNHDVWEKKSKYLRKIGFNIEKNVAVDAGFQFIRNSGIKIEEFTTIGRNVKFYNFNDISIGRFCMIAGETQLANGTHKIDSFVPESGILRIGHGVWIGHGAKIIGIDIEIGNNAVIGAGSLVLKSVEANAIMAGVPAKQIGVRAPTKSVWHIGNTWFSSETFTQIMCT